MYMDAFCHTALLVNWLGYKCLSFRLCMMKKIKLISYATLYIYNKLHEQRQHFKLSQTKIREKAQS